MRKIIAEFAELAVLGLSMGVIMAVLGIEINFWQIMLLSVSAKVITSIASIVRKAIEKGGSE